MEKKDFPPFEPTIALNYTSAFLEKASFLSSHHKCTLNCLTVIIILINTVPCLLCPSGLHTFHQTLWNDLMRKNNKKKKTKQNMASHRHHHQLRLKIWLHLLLVRNLFLQN